MSAVRHDGRVTADLVGNLIIAHYFLSVLGRIGGVATFSIFLGLAALSLGFVWDTPPPAAVTVIDPPAPGRAA